MIFRTSHSDTSANNKHDRLHYTVSSLASWKSICKLVIVFFYLMSSAQSLKPEEHLFRNASMKCFTFRVSVVNVWMLCPCHVVALAILNCALVFALRLLCLRFRNAILQSVLLVQFARLGKHSISYAVFVSEFHCSLFQLHDWVVSLVN